MVKSSNNIPSMKAPPSKKAHAPVKKSRPTATMRGGKDAGSKILDCAVAVERLSHGQNGAPRKKVASLSMVAKGTFPCTLTKLKKVGLVTYDANFIYPTEEGRQQAQTTNVPADNFTVQTYLKDAYLRNMGKGKDMFMAMCDGRVHNRKELAKSVGVSMSSVPSLLSKMVKLGLVEYVGKEGVQQTDMCFPYDPRVLGQDADSKHFKK